MNLKYERSVKVDSSVHLKIGIFSICILYVRVLDFVCVCGYQFAHQPGRQTGLSSGVMRSARGLWLQISPRNWMWHWGLTTRVGVVGPFVLLSSLCPASHGRTSAGASSAQAPLFGNGPVYSI